MLAEAPRLGPCEVVRAARVAHRRPDSASGSLARRPTRFCWCLCLCLCLCLCALLCSVLRAQCLTPARSYAHTHTHTHALSSSRAVRVAYLLLPLSNDKPVGRPAPARRSTLNAPPARHQVPSTTSSLHQPAFPLSRCPARPTPAIPASSHVPCAASFPSFSRCVYVWHPPSVSVLRHHFVNRYFFPAVAPPCQIPTPFEVSWPRLGPFLCAPPRHKTRFLSWGGFCFSYQCTNQGSVTNSRETPPTVTDLPPTLALFPPLHFGIRLSLTCKQHSPHKTFRTFFCSDRWNLLRRKAWTRLSARR